METLRSHPWSWQLSPRWSITISLRFNGPLHDPVPRSLWQPDVMSRQATVKSPSNPDDITNTSQQVCVGRAEVHIMTPPYLTAIFYHDAASLRQAQSHHSHTEHIWGTEILLQCSRWIYDSTTTTRLQRHVMMCWGGGGLSCRAAV